MKRLALSAFLGLSAVIRAHAEPVNFVTEEYPPFSYREERVLKGTSVEQVEKLMAAAGIDYTMEMLPWARAYSLAQSQPMTCVFSTAHTAKRDPLFKWVEPLLMDRNILIAKAGAGVAPKDLEDAKRYTIGTQREDYTDTILREKGFTKLDVTSDFNATFRKLLNGRIDMMPISELYFRQLKSEQPLEQVLVLSSQPMAIACQKEFPDDLLARMQAALNALIADGTQKAIFAKYKLEGGN
ncbi:transporter substrate-binding domain-containing protein [Rhizobium sp. S152]|uniref:substrate-binding periplasmic protein n=1 Tax=Rhizobium sp. S152 TaxID=3055038 RepID=UPI0025A9A717|nr:transporter substrate-binding domain-containing protein [Rhizobium sp. S152]MDM9628825.1 transporter substrate-binding domain-containing protein [Rhizobium sp. S152]